MFQLCHLIRWFGHYVEEHPNVEANLRMHTKVEPTELQKKIAEYEKNDMIVEQDEKGNFHCGECRISYKDASNYLGKKIRLYKVVESHKDSNDSYPLFGRFKPIE